MGWFRATKATKPDYTGLEIQTSTTTLPVPIVWGVNKIAGNVVWYANFQASNGKTGKGGLFSTPSTEVTYSADVIIALCEGPIDGVNNIWKDQSAYTLAELSLTLYTGATPQAVWGYLASAYPAEAIAYQGTAYVCAASYSLGDSASLGNHNFEVAGVQASSGINGIDADPAVVIYDFLTNSQYGAGFSASSINTSTLYGSSGDSSLQTYCRAMGIAFSPTLTNQEQASSILARWLQIINCAAVWSGGQLKFIPYGDVAIAAGNRATTTNSTAIPAGTSGSGGVGGSAPEVVVCGASEFVADGGVKHAWTGAAFTFIGASAPTVSGTYGMVANGTYLFATADVGTAIQITFTYSIPYAYAPNLTPVYSLTDFDFVDDKGNADPVLAARADPFTLPNIVRVEVSSRSAQYATTPVEARDQSQIELYGPRVGSTVTAHEICDELNIGPIVAQAILQRGLYIRQTFTFKLSWEYCLLEPMDIIEITDANLGLSALAVRVTSVEEDDNGLLTVTAEELTVGVSTPVLYPSNLATSSLVNRGVAAAPVNTPLIYEPPTALSGGVAQVWLGASGGLNGVADPNWGGANVWMSLDGVTYSQIGQVTQPLRQGVLSAATAAATGWDTTNVVALNVAESGAVLSGTTQASAQAGSTLALIDSELIAYETAMLTAANAYTLAGLERGLYASTPAAHAVGAPFARLDGAIFKYSLPDAYIGKTLYFKFQSFNIFGAGLQALANCVAYSHAMIGAGVAIPGNIAGFGAAFTRNSATYTLAGQWTADPNAENYIVEWSTDNATWNACYSGAANSFSSGGWGYLSTLYLRVEGVSGAFSSPTWSQITVPTGTQQTIDCENVGLYVQFDDLSSGLADLVGQDALQVYDDGVVTALSNALSSQSATTKVQASAATATANLAASVSSQMAAQTSATTALATQVTTLNASYNSLSASITAQFSAQATQNSTFASEITTLTASSAAGTASGCMQWVAVSGATGVSAAYQLQVSAAAGGTMEYAGMRLEALSTGTSQVVFDASQFIVENGSTKTVVFATNSDGSLQLQGVTKVATAIESLATTTSGAPVMEIDFANGIIYFNA